MDSRAIHLTTHTVVLQGDLDRVDCESLRDQIIAVASDRSSAVVVDLAAVTFFDSRSLRAIIGAHNELASRGIVLHLDNCTPAIRQVLAVTGVDEIVTFGPANGTR